ncbi:enoyl-CoA hydratase/isomerase family protein [Conexibacter sp. SYSU D00693]|uniref:enoyl-CoA hydratase/isomerase family protein n=1 Tax=Conexibacter sp. SYSU D00693 TaxID=2812560 RepID=UPI00196BA758|nr:enoyl-CoA hydratase/isomerase family protein [Conexibacter sp. SYSU D00693]
MSATHVRSLVTAEDRGPVRHVCINRPEKRNALDDDVVGALRAAFFGALHDPSVHALVIRGNGPVFSAGMDRDTLVDLAEVPGRIREFHTLVSGTWNALEQMLKPTIAEIHGVCIGGALELALACDLRVMADDALVGLPEVKIGLIPDCGGCSRLPAVVGLGRAKELVMTGRLVGAQEALQMGLVNRVVPAEDLSTATDRLVAELLECAPVAVAYAKRVLDAAAKPALASTLEHEVTIQQICAQTIDFVEGTRALQERRAPAFSGC